jgi:hypothetical protein
VHRSPEHDAMRLLLCRLTLLLPLGRCATGGATSTPFQPLSAPGLIFVIGVLSLVDHAQTVGFLYEGPLVCVAEKPVGKRQCSMCTGESIPFDSITLFVNVRTCCMNINK